jgi:hypothetical protein
VQTPAPGIRHGEERARRAPASRDRARSARAAR